MMDILKQWNDFMASAEEIYETQIKQSQFNPPLPTGETNLYFWGLNLDAIKKELEYARDAHVREEKAKRDSQSKKVYIVTSGCYSSYGIDRVFLDKEKAESFCKFVNNDDARVEEYEIWDDYYEIPNKSYYLATAYFTIRRNAIGVYSSSLESAGTSQALFLQPQQTSVSVFDSAIGSLRTYYRSSNNPYGEKAWTFTITKYFDSSKFNSQTAQDQLVKIGFDTCAEVINLAVEQDQDPDYLELNELTARLNKENLD